MSGGGRGYIESGHGDRPSDTLSPATQTNPPMKTTLLSILLALSPGFIIQVMAQEGPPGVPPAEKKEPTERERHRAMEAGARQNMEQQMKAAMEEAAKLEQAGKKEEAQQLRRETKERMHAAMMEREKAARMRDGEGEGPRPPVGGPPRAELENKLKHVEKAISHLREAGMEDAAAQMNRMADRLRNALRGEDQPRPESDRHEEVKRDESKRDEGKREEGKREEGKREEGKREEGKREEGKHEEGKHEDGKHDEAKHDKAQRGEPRRPDNDLEALRREVQELRQAIRRMNQRKGEP